MKLNFKIFKKGKPIYWVIGGVVLFVIFYMIASKGAGGSASSGGVTTISPGPSDAQVAAGVALQTATINANAQMAQINAAAQVQMNQNQTDYEIAKLAAANQSAETQAAADVAKYTSTLDAQTQSQYLTTQQNLMEIQGEYSVSTAKVASQTQLGLAEMQAAMFNKQLETNAQMFSDQLKASTTISMGQAAAGIGGNAGVRAYEALLVTMNNPNNLPINNIGGNFGTGVVVK